MHQPRCSPQQQQTNICRQLKNAARQWDWGTAQTTGCLCKVMQLLMMVRMLPNRCVQLSRPANYLRNTR